MFRRFPECSEYVNKFMESEFLSATFATLILTQTTTFPDEIIETGIELFLAIVSQILVENQ